METTTIAGVGVSRIGLGTWAIGGLEWGAVPDDVAVATCLGALERGINLIDTAPIYGRGHSEEIIARAIREHGRREDFYIATKAGLDWSERGVFANLTPGRLRQEMDDSLRRLGTDYVDLYQVHWPDTLVPVAEVAAILNEFLRDGKTRALGVSNFNESRMRRAHAELQRLGLPLASNQVQYSLLHRTIERNGVLQAAKEMSITIIAYSPLAQGLLTGRFHDDPGSVKQIQGPRKFRGPFRRLARSQRLISELKAIARAHGGTPAQVALAWLTQFNGDTVVVIPGATKARQVEDNAASLHLTLSRAELDVIDARATDF